MPRKTRLEPGRALHVVAASMRPRPDAAENVGLFQVGRRAQRRFNEAAARCRGKPTWYGWHPHRLLASMRPRPDAAENAPPPRGRREAAAASMRPRPDAAENVGLFQVGRRAQRRFNEAAARCRGKPTWYGWHPHRLLASMRPRPDAAENAPPPRGRREAAAASMRPRPDAAENTRRKVSLPTGLKLASMRPRPDAAENPALFDRTVAPFLGFNEAAARCRGKLTMDRSSESRRRWLQ